MPGYMDQTAGGSGFIPGAPTIAQAPMPWQDQEAKIKRTLAMAEALRKNTAQPDGQMVSGHYVAPSWAEQLAPLFNIGQARYAETQADKEQAALAGAQEQGAQQWMQKMPQQREVTSEQPFQAPGIDEADAAQASQGAKVLTKAMQQPTMQERMLWAQEGQRNPLTKALAAAYGADTLIKEPERVAAREERTTAREDRLAQQQAQMAQQRELALKQQELQAAIAAGNLSVRQAQIEMQKFAAQQTAAMRAEGAADRRLTAGQLEEDRAFRRANTLRDDYTKATEKPREALRQAEQVLSLIPNMQNMTAQDQQATVFAFMRMLDPGSVVRESEYRMAEEAKGWLDTLTNYHNVVKSGRRLTPTQVENMHNVAARIKSEMSTSIAGRQSEYAGIADRARLDVRQVIPGYAPQQAQGVPEGAVRPRGAPAAAPAAAPGGPPPGAVRPR